MRGISALVKELGGSAKDLADALSKEKLLFFKPTPGQVGDLSGTFLDTARFVSLHVGVHGALCLKPMSPISPLSLRR